MMLIFFMVVSRLKLTGHSLAPWLVNVRGVGHLCKYEQTCGTSWTTRSVQNTSVAKFQKTITTMTPATESAKACLASLLRSILSVFMVSSSLCYPSRKGLGTETPSPTDQAMAVMTVATAMQVVNAKATAKIAAIFFMIASPRVPSSSTA